MDNSKQISEELLKAADIRINGSRPWDIKVHDERLYKRILSKGSLGLGESYMDGWWDCEELDQFFYKLLSAKLNQNSKILSLRQKLIISSKFIFSKLLNFQSISRSRKVAEEHYNLGNDFYEHMLDQEYMQYTCGYWKNAKNLNEAQKNKLNLICKKLYLQNSEKRQKILELGSGFGGFGNFATKHYNCEITSYNISTEQVAYANKMNKGLPIKTILSDYRNAEKSKEIFDKIVSIGMMEHVGPKNYKNFMKLANKCLKDKGIFVLHTIGSIKTNDPSKDEPWTQKYIFPGGHLPSASQITKAAEDYFLLEDFQNFGHDYDKTLMAWFNNFNKNWPKFKDQYGERFYRMWKYYLLSCAGGFRAGTMQLFQFVFTKGNYGKTYEGAR